MRRKLIMFLILYLVANLYIGWHGFLMFAYLDLSLSSFLYWLLFTIVAFSYLIGRSRLLPRPIARFLRVIGSFYLAVFEFAFILLPFADLASWVLMLFDFKASYYVPLLGLVVTIILLVLLIRGLWNAWSPIIRTYEISVEKKAGALKQIRIAVASDIHLGNIVGKRHLRRLVEHMNALNPDLILLPGDVIDDDIEPFIRNRMSAVMKQLKAPYGVFAVLGNHEYYGGHIEEYVKQMSQIGIRVLRDERELVNNALYIVGRKDKTAEYTDTGGRLSIKELLSDLDLSLPVIVMDHQPYRLDKAAAAGTDVLLSGHTHRGQFAPNHWITRRLFELDWGYLLKDKMHVIVSSGFGTWGPPIRIASRSEIVELVVCFNQCVSEYNMRKY